MGNGVDRWGAVSVCERFGGEGAVGMNRRGAVFLMLGAILAWPARGDAPPAVSEQARQVVEDTTNRTLAVLKDERELLRQQPDRIYALVDTIILPRFDFTRMSRWALGRLWRDASEEQRRHFVEEFRTLLVRTYATALLEYVDQTVAVLPLRAEPNASDVVVRTEVRQPGAPPLPINYSMSAESGDWMVYDVTIDGISLVASYRSTFSNEAAKGGLDRVITLLEQRNRGAKR